MKSFYNFPAAWNLEKEGRLQDGMANEMVAADPFGGKTGKVLVTAFQKP